MTPLLPAHAPRPLLMPGRYVEMTPRRSCSKPKQWAWYPHEWAIVIHISGRWFLVFDASAVGEVLGAKLDTPPVQLRLVA